MNAPKDPACAAMAVVTLLAVAAFFCIVAAAPVQGFDSAPTTLAPAGPAADATHSTGGLK